MKLVLKFWNLRFLNFKLFCTSLVHFVFRSIWSSSNTSKISVKTVALRSMNTIPKYTLVYAPCCCTSITCNSNCISTSRMECIGVSYTVAKCVLSFSAGCAVPKLLIRKRYYVFLIPVFIVQVTQLVQFTLYNTFSKIPRSTRMHFATRVRTAYQHIRHLWRCATFCTALLPCHYQQSQRPTDSSHRFTCGREEQ
jgi:hypothetical protein